jgi:LemA protein
MSIIGYILFGVVVALVVYGIFMYNRFVALVNRTQEAWSDIDVQLKRRYDLIPNLVETVKGYAAHERETFDAVTSARARATEMTIDPSNVTVEQIQAFESAQIGLEQALGRLLAVAENYPDLKANQNFLELQRELTDTENKIQAARRFYNGNVRDLNTGLQQFPGNIIGNMFKFEERAFFELDEDEKEVAKDPVKVDFNA